MIKLSRKEIYELVWREPMTAIAARYKISDVGFRKMCMRMKIPVPKGGHWAQVQAGQTIKPPPLPVNSQVRQYAELEERLPEDNITTPSELQALTKKLVKEKLPFKVPPTLTRPDPLTIAAKASLAKLTSNYHPGMAMTAKGELDIRVTPKNVSRALRFMDAIIKLVRARGYRYEANSDGNFIKIRGISLKVSFRERTTKVKTQGNSYNTYEWKPNGNLVFRLEGRLKAEWHDNKSQLLEEQLAKILAKFELTAKQEEAYHEEMQLWKANWEKERALRDERELRRAEELRNVKDLIEKARQWKQAQLVREYLAAMVEPNEEWYQWALHKADWLDPLLFFEDEWLDFLDRNSF